MMKVAYVKGRFTYYTDGLVSQENPDHLRALEDRLIAAFTDESVSADEYVAMAHEMVHARSDHLRAAIERIGIEKPSDYTLVMEEVGRMEAEEKLAEAILERSPIFEDGFNRDRVLECIVEGIRQGRQQSSPLLHAASLFISEAERMGYGKTSEKALPGSFDLLVKAVREVKG
jgi:hypothetical protein